MLNVKKIENVRLNEYFKYVKAMSPDLPLPPAETLAAGTRFTIGDFEVSFSFSEKIKIFSYKLMFTFYVIHEFFFLFSENRTFRFVLVFLSFIKMKLVS